MRYIVRTKEGENNRRLKEIVFALLTNLSMANKLKEDEMGVKYGKCGSAEECMQGFCDDT
jgi:hypothetical protein